MLIIICILLFIPAGTLDYPNGWLFIALLFIVTIAIDNTFAFIATSTSNVSNTFKPYEFKENDLIINKTVEHPYGEYYQLPNINFVDSLGQLR